MLFRSKGSNNYWYKPVAVDGRASGARTRHIQKTHTPESTTATYRNLFAGAGELRKASRNIFNEEKDDAFERDEKMLLEVENKIKSLSEKLLKENKMEKKDVNEN